MNAVTVKQALLLHDMPQINKFQMNSRISNSINNELLESTNETVLIIYQINFLTGKSRHSITKKESLHEIVKSRYFSSFISESQRPISNNLSAISETIAVIRGCDTIFKDPIIIIRRIRLELLNFNLKWD